MARRFVALAARVGQLTVVLVGAAVLLGLPDGPAAYRLARVGDPLLAGKVANAGIRTSALVASLTGPVLRLTNKGAGRRSTSGCGPAGSPSVVCQGLGVALSRRLRRRARR